MDISSFSRPEFVPKKWINESLKGVSADHEKEAFLQSLVTKLQLYIQEVNSVIEDNSLKAVKNLPNINEEVDLLNQNTSLLFEKIRAIKRELEIIEKNADNSVVNLEKIDYLRGTLQRVKHAIHEADNWSILAADIEESFDRSDTEKITSTLISMQQSLSVLSSAEDYEEKKMQLEGLKNRLEALVSPNIVKAFTTYNFEDSLKFVKMFQEIERLPQLLKYYIECQKCSLCQHWKSIVDSDQDSNFLEQLRSLYDLLLMNWQKQTKWCEEVFRSTNMVEMMIELYADVLVDLEPSLASCMDTSLKQSPQPLLLLLDFHQCSVQFQQNLDSLYLFNNEKEPPNWNPVLKSIYLPYVPYLSKYGTLERQMLDNYLWDTYLSIDTGTDLVDCIRSLSLTIPVVMNVATDALNRCMKFSRGCTLNGLIIALKGYFLKYIDKFSDICNRLSEQTENAENWPLLKSCLSFQQIIGELLHEIKKFDSQLLKTLKNVKNDGKVANYAKLILNSVAQKNYEDLLNSVTTGSCESLFSNVLNVIEKLSYELHGITYHVSFKPVSFHLEKTAELLEKMNHDMRELPDYSYSPLEYITQIGEHLITLPQHLEPFLSQENEALSSLLQIINKETESVSVEKGTYADILLTLVAHGTCQAYADQLLNIRELNSSATRQLATDITYLSNVLEELGLGLTENLRYILNLLRFSPEEYQFKSVGFPPKLVAAIRQTRKILST